MSEPPRPLFSIVTVVYNAEQLVADTVQSVLAQTYEDYEYLVIDGASTDQTLAVLEPYQDRIDTLVSEPDRGIYDAMNKAIGLASGKYINFMNAGDRFYSPETLEKVAQHWQQAGGLDRVDIVYGKVVKISSEVSNFQYEKGKAVSANAFFLSIPMCHQAMFIKSDLFRTVGGYSLDYQAGAFYGWLGAYYGYRQSLDYLSFVDQRIAYYLDGGYSFQMKKVIDRERLGVAKRYFSRKYVLLNYLVYVKEWLKANGLILLGKLRLLDRYRKLKYTLTRQKV
jgi:glycosyltransferase involved in cell wall biosynthesis